MSPSKAYIVGNKNKFGLTNEQIIELLNQYKLDFVRYSLPNPDSCYLSINHNWNSIYSNYRALKNGKIKTIRATSNSGTDRNLYIRLNGLDTNLYTISLTSGYAYIEDANISLVQNDLINVFVEYKAEILKDCSVDLQFIYLP